MNTICMTTLQIVCCRNIIISANFFQVNYFWLYWTSCLIHYIVLLYHLWIEYTVFLFYSINIKFIYFYYYFKVGDPALCTHLSNELMTKYNIYVQQINYPTVAKGQEKLRVAPTPHHTRPMMDQFVKAVKDVWLSSGLELKQGGCCPKQCEFCMKPLEYEKFFAREKICGRSNCTYASLQSSMNWGLAALDKKLSLNFDMSFII